MSCNTVISGGIGRDCKTVAAPVGVDKDLILVNYDDYDHIATMEAANREADDTNKNIEGLTAIHLKSGAVQYTFEGTEYSVIPTVTGEVKEDGDSWFVHSIAFTAYSKTAQARKVIEDLAASKVIAICKDRSTGLMELFGAEQGLKLNGLERTYTGSQNSNFYACTLATPDVAVVRESQMAELALTVTTAA